MELHTIPEAELGVDNESDDTIHEKPVAMRDYERVLPRSELCKPNDSKSYETEFIGVNYETI